MAEPLGRNDRGLPLGVQAAAAPGRDHAAVAVAIELERALGGLSPATADQYGGATMSDLGLHQLLYYDYVPYYLERREPFREDHLAHAQRWKDAGTLVNAGVIVSRGTPGAEPDGALFVFVIDPADLHSFVITDPYVLNGIVTGHRIVPWTVVL